MATLRPYALKNPKTDTVVPGALVLSNIKPVSGNWFPVVEGIERNVINPVSYDNTVKLTYPSCVNSQRFGDYAKTFIETLGYTPDNVVLSESICSDDIDGPVYADIQNIGQTPASQNDFLGPFMSGGLSGYPHTGILGIQAWGSHITNTTNGALFFINTPHIGISQVGNVGRVWRRGKTQAQSLTDNTCGAVATAITWVAANALAPVVANFPNDYQNYQLCAILFPFKVALAAIPTYGAKMVYATEKIRLAADTFLTGASGIIAANVGVGIDVFYCSGTFINTDDGYNAYVDVTSFQKYNSVGGWVNLTTSFLAGL
jgi:Limiting CO2-inducible proteins B/C beta carbonyic anhydrases